MPIVISGKTYSLGSLGSILALIVLLLSIIFVVIGKTTLWWAFVLIGLLALAVLL